MSKLGTEQHGLPPDVEYKESRSVNWQRDYSKIWAIIEKLLPLLLKNLRGSQSSKESSREYISELINDPATFFSRIADQDWSGSYSHLRFSRPEDERAALELVKQLAEELGVTRARELAEGVAESEKGLKFLERRINEVEEGIQKALRQLGEYKDKIFDGDAGRCREFIFEHHAAQWEKGESDDPFAILSTEGSILVSPEYFSLKVAGKEEVKINVSKATEDERKRIFVIANEIQKVVKFLEEKKPEERTLSARREEFDRKKNEAELWPIDENGRFRKQEDEVKDDELRLASAPNFDSYFSSVSGPPENRVPVATVKQAVVAEQKEVKVVNPAEFKDEGKRYFRCSECSGMQRVSKEDYSKFQNGEPIKIECPNKHVGTAKK